jgi:hypothetical protein
MDNSQNQNSCGACVGCLAAPLVFGILWNTASPLIAILFLLLLYEMMTAGSRTGTNAGAQTPPAAVDDHHRPHPAQQLPVRPEQLPPPSGQSAADLWQQVCAWFKAQLSAPPPPPPPDTWWTRFNAWVDRRMLIWLKWWLIIALVYCAIAVVYVLITSIPE